MLRSTNAMVGGLALLLAGALLSRPDAASSGGWGDGYAFESRTSRAARGIESVDAETRNGGIEVRVWDEDSIAVVVTEKVRRHDLEDSEEIADKVDLTLDDRDGVLFVRMDLSSLSKQEKKSYSAAFEILVPAKVSLELESSNGGISVGKVEGSVSAHTTNGGIELGGSMGDVDLHTTNGSIEAGFVEGEIEMRTTNGNIVLSGIRGNVTSATTNGSIQLIVDEESDFLVEASTTNGMILPFLGDGFVWETNKRKTRLEGEYGSGRHKVRLKTTNGSVRIDEI